jgi:cytochrome c peroxidase
VSLFKEMFPPEGAVTADHLAKAIVGFARTVSDNSPFDRLRPGTER